MKINVKAKIAAVFMAALTAAGAAAAMPASATYNNSIMIQGDAFDPGCQNYLIYCARYKFRAGKYWNGGNPDSYTSTPCNGHTNDNHFIQHNIYSAGYTSYIGAVNGSQCYGFAAKLAYDFYGKADAWIRFSNPTNFQFRVGDIVRINNQHSVFITEVNGSSLKIADCNAGGTCIIRWNVAASYTNNKFYLGGTAYNVSFVERPILAGDVNGDSQITWEDVDIISQIFRGIYDFSGKPQRVINVMKEAADLDNDGQISFNDVYIAYYQFDHSGIYRQQRFLTNVGNWS